MGLLFNVIKFSCLHYWPSQPIKLAANNHMHDHSPGSVCQVTQKLGLDSELVHISWARLPIELEGGTVSWAHRWFVRWEASSAAQICWELYTLAHTLFWTCIDWAQSDNKQAAFLLFAVKCNYSWDTVNRNPQICLHLIRICCACLQVLLQVLLQVQIQVQIKVLIQIQVNI